MPCGSLGHWGMRTAYNGDFDQDLAFVRCGDWSLDQSNWLAHFLDCKSIHVGHICGELGENWPVTEMEEEEAWLRAFVVMIIINLDRRKLVEVRTVI